jgi:CDP-paratose 2-epimerase
MANVIVTGAGGLVGSTSVRHFAGAGYDVLGIENDMRARFFGPAASTAPQVERLRADFPGFQSVDLDIRDADGVDRLFRQLESQIELVIHTAAQPSHDWAAQNPRLDFGVNAIGTLNLLEAARHNCPDATFIYTSTNKVYGDRPNDLPLVELESRLELPPDHEWFGGIGTAMPIDRSLHSLFGVSKLSGDLLVQEYGRYFSMPTVAFRGGCLTGPAHAGAQLHGFLSYLMRCTIGGDRYTVYGYDGKQVRDNLHSDDLVSAFSAFHSRPCAGAVYNIGGGRFSNCSMLEAIDLCQEIAGRELAWELSSEPRLGDHRWWISSLAEFQTDYPEWSPTAGIEQILREIHDENVEAWAFSARR